MASQAISGSTQNILKSVLMFGGNVDSTKASSVNLGYTDKNSGNITSSYLTTSTGATGIVSATIGTVQSFERVYNSGAVQDPVGGVHKVQPHLSTISFDPSSPSGAAGYLLTRDGVMWNAASNTLVTSAPTVNDSFATDNVTDDGWNDKGEFTRWGMLAAVTGKYH